MERSPPARVELRLDASGEQRVAEANAFVVQLEDCRSHRRAEARGHRRRVGCDGLDERDRRLAQQRNGLEHLADAFRQGREARRDELGQRARNGQSPICACAPARLVQSAAELERVEGIPARHVVKLHQRRPGERRAETLA
jgi:hypothetical protein